MRREGSYIYEEFMPTGGTDVKVGDIYVSIRLSINLSVCLSILEVFEMDFSYTISSHLYFMQFIDMRTCVLLYLSVCSLLVFMFDFILRYFPSASK